MFTDVLEGNIVIVSLLDEGLVIDSIVEIPGMMLSVDSSKLGGPLWFERLDCVDPQMHFEI